MFRQQAGTKRYGSVAQLRGIECHEEEKDGKIRRERMSRVDRGIESKKERDEESEMERNREKGRVEKGFEKKEKRRQTGRKINEVLVLKVEVNKCNTIQ